MIVNICILNNPKIRTMTYLCHKKNLQTLRPCSVLFSKCCFHETKLRMKILFLNLFLKFKNVFSIILKNNLKNEKTNMFGKNVSKNYYWNNVHKQTLRPLT